MAEKIKIYREKVESIKGILHDYETRNEPQEPRNHDEQISEDAIYARLKRACFKYNLRLCEEAVFNIMAVSLIFILTAIVYSRYFEIPLTVQAAFISAPAIFAIFIIINALRNFKDKNEIVKILDCKLGLKERLITSLEYAQLGKKSKLYNTLISDAVNFLDNKSINKALNRKITKSARILVILASILGIAAILMPPQMLNQIPSVPNMLALLDAPVISPDPTPKTEVAKQEKEEEPDKILDKNQEQEKKEDRSDGRDNTPKISQSEEKTIEKDINDIIKRILSLLGNFKGSDNLKTDGGDRDKGINELSAHAQADQDRKQQPMRQEGTSSKALDSSESMTETNNTETSKDDTNKDDTKQGQQTKDDFIAQKPQEEKKRGQTENNGTNSPSGTGEIPQGNTNSGDADDMENDSSQTAVNNQGVANDGEQKRGKYDEGKDETDSASGSSVASAEKGSDGNTSKGSPPGLDKKGENGDQSGRNDSGINNKPGEDYKGSETNSGLADGSVQNKPLTEMGVKSKPNGDSISDSSGKQADSDKTDSEKNDKKGGDELAKTEGGDKGEGEKTAENIGNNQLDSIKAEKNNGSEDPVGQKIAEQDVDTKQGKDPSDGKAEVAGDNHQGKTDEPKESQTDTQGVSNANGLTSKGLTSESLPSLEKQGKQAAGVIDKAGGKEGAGGSNDGESGSSGTKEFHGGKQKSIAENADDLGKNLDGQKKDDKDSGNRAKSSKSAKNRDEDSIKGDIANLLDSVENRIKDYDKKGESQPVEAKPDTGVSDNVSQSNGKDKEEDGKIAPDDTSLSNTEGGRGDISSDNDESESGSGAGNESSDKLYSQEGEKLDFTKGKEIEMLIDGEKDGDAGQKREAKSYGTKLAPGEWIRPSVPVDEDASLNRYQSEDDAIKNAKIPSEYEKIIKDMYINND